VLSNGNLEEIQRSASNVVNEVLKNTNIDGDYKKTLLAAKSWYENFL
jgi:hypothetical protein